MNSQIENYAPFHHGEIAIQKHYGVSEQAYNLGTRVIRNHMLEQHRRFYEQLPFILIGSVDDQARPWASILVGGQGFIQTLDERTLNINAKTLYADPLSDNLQVGTDVGLLGIMMSNLRRNRLNGRIIEIIGDLIVVEVEQSFGNCPKYIQQRDVTVTNEINYIEQAKDVTRSHTLGNVEQQLISSSDTLFIASQFSEDENHNSYGVDVSHRGGRPGFVRIDDERTLSIPDFSGNNHFNTLGNLLLNPKTGLLFIDFESGGLLYITGCADIFFEGEEVASFVGAERVIRFTLDESIYVKQSLPLEWQFRGYSKFLNKTGDWGTL